MTYYQIDSDTSAEAMLAITQRIKRLIRDAIQCRRLGLRSTYLDWISMARDAGRALKQIRTAQPCLDDSTQRDIPRRGTLWGQPTCIHDGVGYLGLCADCQAERDREEDDDNG